MGGWMDRWMDRWMACIKVFLFMHRNSDAVDKRCMPTRCIRYPEPQTLQLTPLTPQQDPGSDDKVDYVERVWERISFASTPACPGLLLRLKRPMLQRAGNFGHVFHMCDGHISDEPKRSEPSCIYMYLYVCE